MQKKHISVSDIAFVGNEQAYVLDCLQSGWISSIGKYIIEFEESFARFCGTGHAISCCNGTVALHLALIGLGIGSGDEVIVPSLTFVASANAISYCGAQPVFVDSEVETGNIDVSLIESAINNKTKAIMVVHLYGCPVDMDPVLELARKYNLKVIEDAAEAHGAEYKGRRVGSIGDVATFSFFGNKIITSGEGGMVVTNDDQLAELIRQLKGQGQDPQRRYWFPLLGYNYRMTNIAAAIGLAQLEKIAWHLERRSELAQWYQQYLHNIPGITMPKVQFWAKSVYWMNCIVVGNEYPLDRDELMAALASEGIDSRPYFYPMHILPIYLQQNQDLSLPVAEYLGSHGINLPSSAKLNEQDVVYIADVIRQISKRLQ